MAKYWQSKEQPRNVNDGDRTIAVAFSREDAARIVAALNASEATAPAAPVENRQIGIEEMRKHAGQSANVVPKPDCGFAIG